MSSAASSTIKGNTAAPPRPAPGPSPSGAPNNPANRPISAQPRLNNSTPTSNNNMNVKRPNFQPPSSTGTGAAGGGGGGGMVIGTLHNIPPTRNASKSIGSASSSPASAPLNASAPSPSSASSRAPNGDAPIKKPAPSSDNSGKSSSNINAPSPSSSSFSSSSSSSLSSSVPSSPRPELSTEEMEVECFENERYYPFIGWSKKLLPTDPPSWSNRAENKSTPKEDFKNPPGYIWATDWLIDRSKGGDIDGWMYATDFGKDWVKEKKALHMARHRKWIRTRTPSTIPATPSPSNAATTTTDDKSNNGEEKKLTNGPSLKNLYANPSLSSSSSSSQLPPSKSSNGASSSASKGALNLNVTAVKPQTAVIRVWEHQRYYPLVGWSEKLLPTDKKHPWADERGGRIGTKEEITVDNVEWRWFNDWSVLVEASSTDKDGWQYAFDWPNVFKKLSGKPGIDTFVRRRVWQRTKVMIPRATAANKKKDAAAFFARLDAFKADLEAEQSDEDLVALSSATW